MEAQKEGACAGCPDPVVPGDEIEPAPYFRWAHARCHDAVVQKYMGARRTRPGYSVACPTCGAEVDAYCVTEAGKTCSVHPARRDLALLADGT